MSWLISYICVAAYWHGEFNGRDHARGLMTPAQWGWNLFAATLWPLGLVLICTPRHWWNWFRK